jgi:polysaccharide biosynthesis/export protein
MNLRRIRCNRAMHIVSLAILLASVGGCFASSKEFNEIVEETSNSQKDFLLGPEDVLDIVIWKNEDLSQKAVVVRPDGKISMPLIGEVVASGRTANQLASQIATRLKEYKDNPAVTVSVKEVNSYYVYVLGEVMKPGKYQLKSHATVLQAVAIASGFNNYASKNKMKVIRHVQGEDGKAREIRIPARYDDLVSGTGEIGNFVLKTGDVVIVP